MTVTSASSAVTRFFFEITPERVLSAVETAGFETTGRCQALNSFENRVYDVELEMGDTKPAHPSANRRVVKFYRPGRWTESQILEEHEFLGDLAKAEIPAIGPLRFPDGSTLKQMPDSQIWFALFPKVGGRAPDELSLDQLQWIGRLLGRIHNVGASKAAPHRIILNPQTYGSDNLEFLVNQNLIPLDYQARYQDAAQSIIDKVTPWFAEANYHRLHGDCHLGNLLWSQDGPYFLDFDDMVCGPAIQDLWLLLPGRDEQSKLQLSAMLEGYEEMRSFDRSTLRLIEPLRALRFIHYTAWLAKRWDDPAFPLAFPQFGTHRYWNDETEDLENQLRIIESREDQ